MTERKVWDRTTRIFHWVNAITVICLMGIGLFILNSGSFDVSREGKLLLKTIHVFIGYVFVINIAWRLVWGFVGGPHARWKAILPAGGFLKSLLAGSLAKRGAARA
jgi:cytochrome b